MCARPRTLTANPCRKADLGICFVSDMRNMRTYKEPVWTEGSFSHNCEYEAGTGVHNSMLLSFLRRQVAAYCSGRAAGPNILCERLDLLSKCAWVREDFYYHLVKDPRTPVVDIGLSGRGSPTFRTSSVAKCGEGKEENQQSLASTSARSCTTFS